MTDKQGKSIQAIAIAYYYRRDWPLLIVVPSSLTLTWKCEILKWLKGKIYDNDINIIKTTKDQMLEYDTKSYMNKPLTPKSTINFKTTEQINTHTKVYSSTYQISFLFKIFRILV